MSIILANFGKYAISDCPFILLFEARADGKVKKNLSKSNKQYKMARIVLLDIYLYALKRCKIRRTVFLK